MCNQCANPIKGSKYYDVTCRDIRFANEHEDQVDKLQNREKKVDDIASADEIKLKRIEEIKKSLRGLSAEELDEELEKLRAELEELKKDKEESKSASLEMTCVDNTSSSRSGSKLEHIGIDNYEAQGHYSVLKYINQSALHEGDALLLRMGSSV